MGGYSGDYEFDSDDDELATLNRWQRPPLVPALPGGGAPAPFPSGGPRPMLYIKSDRLIELSRRMPVNQDRPALVHSLIQAYGLLEVRRRVESSYPPAKLRAHLETLLSSTAPRIWPGGNERALNLPYARFGSLPSPLRMPLPAGRRHG